MMRKTGLQLALDFSRVTAASRTDRLILLAVVVGLLTGCISLLFLHENPVSAADTPPDFTDTRVTSVDSPTALAFTPDGRLLVTSEPGRLWVYKDGALLANPALDISGKVCTNGARGLLGVAVDPNFATNHYIYLFYTFKKHGVCPQNTANVPVNRVERYVLSATSPAAPTSARSARRRSPRACATPSVSPSTRTPRAHASLSTTSARPDGRR